MTGHARGARPPTTVGDALAARGKREPTKGRGCILEVCRLIMDESTSQDVRAELGKWLEDRIGRGWYEPRAIDAPRELAIRDYAQACVRMSLHSLTK